MDFETLSPIWAETLNRAQFFKISLQQYKDPVLFPSDTRHERYDYWKVPERATISILLHRPVKAEKRKMS